MAHKLIHIILLYYFLWLYSYSSGDEHGMVYMTCNSRGYEIAFEKYNCIMTVVPVRYLWLHTDVSSTSTWRAQNKFTYTHFGIALSLSLERKNTLALGTASNSENKQINKLLLLVLWLLCDLSNVVSPVKCHPEFIFLTHSSHDARQNPQTNRKRAKWTVAIQCLAKIDWLAVYRVSGIDEPSASAMFVITPKMSVITKYYTIVLWLWLFLYVEKCT